MKCSGACTCGKVKVSVVAEEKAKNIHPRICDCEYCKRNPSSVISHPSMVIKVMSELDVLKTEKNGEGLANFYRCPNCDCLVVIACSIAGILRGAVNADILCCDGRFGEDVNVSPKSLNAHEKMERWSMLWGTIRESA